ncbi:MAG: putative phosphodiesterase, partial [Methylobacteriaceae bacterium]|nr:putative phosphodiesterase [Methylobacteriaceae bacterium]
NVYGWFAREERGIYGLTEAGRGALTRWPGVLG